MLTMVHANPARIVDGNLRVDRKFHIGMRSIVSKINVPIVSVHPEGAVDDRIMDEIEIPLAQLGYGVHIVKRDSSGVADINEQKRLRAQIANSRVMYGNSLGSVSIARDLGIPYIMIVEYDLKTQASLATNAVANRLRRVARVVRCFLNYSLFQIPDMRKAHSLHCNGYPIFDETRRFNGKRLLYLDSRMSEDLVIERDVLVARLKSRNTRPLRLLYSGRYEAMKGADHVVRVGLECIKLGLEFELHCYGQGGLKAEMQALADSAVGKSRIVIHDAIPYPELVDLSRTFDIFVCCHIQADPSCTYIESFGAGLPIVGYDNRMWKRLSQESGVGCFSRLGDPALVAMDIKKLAEQSDLLETMSHQAREFASKHCFEREFAFRTNAINAALASIPATDK